MNLLGATLVYTHSTQAGSPPAAVGYFFIGLGVFMVVLIGIIAYTDRGKTSKPILKRTKNPYRRYKRVR